MHLQYTQDKGILYSFACSHKKSPIFVATQQKLFRMRPADVLMKPRRRHAYLFTQCSLYINVDPEIKNNTFKNRKKIFLNN